MPLSLIHARKAVLRRDIPKYIDRTPKFAPLTRWEMIIEWHKSLNRNPQVQRLGFKAAGDFVEAVKEAQRLCQMLNSSYGRTLVEIDKSEFCRLVAVYEERAFKDYSAEPLYNREEQKKLIQKHVDSVRAYDKTESTKVPRNSRPVIRVQ